MLARPRWPSSRVRGRCSPAAGRPCDIGGQGGAMTIRVGISGFGRVGRAFLRRPSSAMTCRSWPSTTSPTRPLAHPLAFDSTYGRLTAADNELTVAGGGRPQGRRPCLGRLPHRGPAPFQQIGTEQAIGLLVGVHRLMARPRERHDHTDPPVNSRHGLQAASPRPHHLARLRPGPLHALRPAPSVPRSPLIMPISPARAPPATCAGQPGIGITTISASGVCHPPGRWDQGVRHDLGTTGPVT